MELPINTGLASGGIVQSLILDYIWWTLLWKKEVIIMKKALIALSLLALFASCKEKESTCECLDYNKNIVFKKTFGGLTYSEFQTYCSKAETDFKHSGNMVTCTVRKATKSDKDGADTEKE